MGFVQVSPTLDIARDCSRFIITFFDLISTSPRRICISALPLSPRTSIVREVYKQYEGPLVRIVRGLQTSWEPVVTTVYGKGVQGAVWSPCNRFTAVAKSEAVGIRDAATLVLFHPPPPEPRSPCFPSTFSRDCRFLARFTFGHWTSWDLKAVGVDSALLEGRVWLAGAPRPYIL